jgi:hypothetical protein
MTELMATGLILLGLVCCYLLARERFGRTSSTLAVLGVGAGSPVLWYLMGSLDGSAPIRLALGSIAAYGWVRAARGASPPAVRWWAGAGLVVGAAATLTWLDGPLAMVQASPSDVLWSSRGGLLANSPVVYAGVVGLCLFWRVDRVQAAVGLALLAFTTVAVAAHPHWWSAAWPAAPAFVALTPYVVCGVAALVDASARFAARRPVLAIGSLLSVLVLWNLTLMKMAHDGQYHLGEPASFGDVGAAQARALHGWIGHPPSAPANLAFAIANGVRPGAYDILAPSRLLAGGDSTGAVDIGTDDGPFVGEGWYGAEQDGGTSFRWASRSAFLDVPLDHAADLAVRIDARPYQPPKAPPQQLTLVVNGVPHGPVTLASGWHPALVTVPRANWRSGVNHLELRFAYDARPSDVGIADGRALSASIDAIALRVAP